MVGEAMCHFPYGRLGSRLWDNKRTEPVHHSQESSARGAVQTGYIGREQEKAVYFSDIELLCSATNPGQALREAQAGTAVFC